MGELAALVGSGTAFLGSLWANSWLVRVAQRLGWCDRPEAATGGVLKVHTRPVPFVGGLGVMLAVVAAVGLHSLVGQSALWPLVLAGLPALAIGMWDDFRWKALSIPVPKLALQLGASVLAAWVLWLAGIRIVPGLPLVGFALASVFVLGAVNAVNLEDGMDGLAGGEAAISALGLAWTLESLGRPDAALVGAGLAAALAGFLVLNWHPARLFLGDGGSHLVGALLAVLAVCVLATHGFKALPATLLLVGLPVLDTLWVIGRRLVSGKRLMAGDRNHLYDLLCRSGLSVRQTVVLCWFLQAGLVVAGRALVGVL
jgi:UDP-GlcNAc:undecaprenyl-phosphate GlcNAc-1-phosphate transferase